MEIALPEKVKQIIARLSAAGFEAYAVGGCIRDSILGRIPEDWDITTSARPAQVKRLFRRTVDTGIAHGTVTVMEGKEGYEVTTYRIDGEYQDGRHPDQVTFTDQLKEDLLRRDFTINAMAYNQEKGLIDLYGGRRDLELGLIRCVGEPRERFKEDALRIMRAVRFAAQLQYRLEEETQKAIRELAPALSRISAERIQAELLKILLSPNPDQLKTAYELGITKIILPEFDRMMETEQNNPHHCDNVGQHTLMSLRHVPPQKVLRLAMLFHDAGKPGKRTTDQQGIDHFWGHGELSVTLLLNRLKELKFDHLTIEQTGRLIKFHDCRPQPVQGSIRKLVYNVGEDLFPMLLIMRRADILAQSEYRREEKLQYEARIAELYQEIIQRKDCLSLKELAVSGKDLIEAGMKPGKEIGDLLKYMLETVLENPELNHKGILLKLIPKE